jgi:hypothetical protein
MDDNPWATEPSSAGPQGPLSSPLHQKSLLDPPEWQTTDSEATALEVSSSSNHEWAWSSGADTATGSKSKSDVTATGWAVEGIDAAWSSKAVDDVQPSSEQTPDPISANRWPETSALPNKSPSPILPDWGADEPAVPVLSARLENFEIAQPEYPDALEDLTAVSIPSNLTHTAADDPISGTLRVSSFSPEEDAWSAPASSLWDSSRNDHALSPPSESAPIDATFTESLSTGGQDAQDAWATQTMPTASAREIVKILSRLYLSPRLTD